MGREVEQEGRGDGMSATPRTDKACRESLDGTGCVTRMEPIYKCMEDLEYDLAEARAEIAKLRADLAEREGQIETDRRAERFPCPHCRNTLLISEDRGIHCDGCDDLSAEDIEAILASRKG